MSFYIALVNSIIALIMMVYNWRINRNSIFLSLLILFLSSYVMAGYVVTYSQSRFSIAVAFGHFAPLWYLSPPLLYLYIRGTLKDRFKLHVWDLFHLIPFMISLVGLFPYLISPFEEKLRFADEIIKNINAPKYIRTNWILSFEINLLLRPLLMMAYALVSFVLIIKQIRVYALSSSVPKMQWQFIRKWMLLITCTLFLISVPSLLLSFFYILNNEISASLVRNNLLYYMIDLSQLLLLVVLFLFPQIIYGLPIIRTSDEKVIDGQDSPDSLLNYQEKAQQSNVNYAQLGSLDPDPFYDLGQKILRLMEQEKPYVNVDFSLDDLAEMLKVPKHHLYYCFQNILNKKFTTLRTEYRIEYSKKLLSVADFRRVTLDSVGRDAGFASKSTFYNTFKSSVGCSPGEYARVNNRLDFKDFSE